MGLHSLKAVYFIDVISNKLVAGVKRTRKLDDELDSHESLIMAQKSVIVEDIFQVPGKH